MKNKPIAECIGAVLDFSKRFRSEDTITHYRRVCTQVQSYYNNCRETHFSFAVQQEIEKQASEYLGKDSTSYYKNGSLLLRVLRMLQDFNEGIPFQEHYHREKRYKYKLQPFYQKLSEEFKESLTVSINTIPTIYSIARDFFHYLQESGISDIDNVSHDVIYAFMKEEYHSHQGSTPNVVYVLRRICVFFRKCGFIHVPKTIMPFSLSPPKNKVLPAFKTGDMERILSQPDTETNIGKRDYAVLVLASVTGMRAIDIANIRLLDFQWEDRAIHFIQHKTGNGVTLPLDSRAIYAVSDYILHGRPESSCPFVFLTKTQPYRKLSDKSSISNILNTYVRLSGIEKNPHDGKAFHAFRRSMGSWLLETYAAPELISQILGHKSTDVLKRYLPLSPSKLRACALGLKGIPVKSEVYK